jgi:hypothetical protein
VYIAVALVLLAMRPLLTTVPPHDFWWHMATGRVIVETGAIPTVDSFSFTQAGQTFYNQGWLAQVLMYGLHQLGGVELLLLVQAGVLALAYGLLLWLCIRRTGAVRLSVALLLLTTMPMSFNNWVIRPQTYVLPIFAAFLFILTEWRLGKNRERPPQSRRTRGEASTAKPGEASTAKPGEASTANQTNDHLRSATHPSSFILHPFLWLLPLLMVLWVNMHGSFVLGGALIGLTFVGEALRRLLQRPKPGETPPELPPLRQLFFWGAVTAAAMLLNPRGFEVLGYVGNLVSSSQVTTLVQEWAPPTIRDTGGLIFFLFIFLLLVVLAYARRPDPVDMLFTVVFLWLALGATRNNIWFGMVATPLLIVQAASLRPVPAASTRPGFQGLPMFNGLLIGLMALLLALCLPWLKPSLGLPPEVGSLLDPNTPVAAVETMQREQPRPQRLFHAMGYGSYLIWAAPNQKVFIDPRIELYPFDQWQEYLRLSNAQDVPELLATYQFDGMLLDNKEQQPLLERLSADPAWQVRYSDEHSTYLVRR